MEEPLRQTNYRKAKGRIRMSSEEKERMLYIAHQHVCYRRYVSYVCKQTDETIEELKARITLESANAAKRV